MNGLLTLTLAFILSVGTSTAFQVPRLARSERTLRHPHRLSAVATDEAAPRDYNSFVEWAMNYGIAAENLQLNEQEKPGEWGGFAIQAASAGSRVLYVPAMLRLTSRRIRTEEFAALEPTIAQYFDATNTNGQINLACQFYIFLKVLQEFDKGEQSPYYAWLNALPRKFTTAITFDSFEVDCLPPFVGFLAKRDRANFDLFVEVLNSVDTPSISAATKADYEACKWAFNVVFTRARAAFEEAEIIPMADMLNHRADPNVEVQYDDEGNVHVILLRDVQPNEPLYKSYGQVTNPSRFLATYGFFDVSSQATYCKLMSGKTLTPELVNLGFVYDRMVFYHETGAIADEVWDVMLYTILGNIDKGQQQQFYNAHMQGDYATKQNMHAHYRLQASQGLLQHVDEMLIELSNCASKIQQENHGGHENLAMIQYHNDFVRETFLKVRTNLEQMAAQSGGQ